LEAQGLEKLDPLEGRGEGLDSSTDELVGSRPDLKNKRIYNYVYLSVFLLVFVCFQSLICLLCTLSLSFIPSLSLSLCLFYCLYFVPSVSFSLTVFHSFSVCLSFLSICFFLSLSFNLLLYVSLCISFSLSVFMLLSPSLTHSVCLLSISLS
jgi:hypothetical protein